MPVFRPARLFRPESIALIGAGTEIGMRVLANLQAGGFRGALHCTETPEALHPADLAVICGGDVDAAFAALGRLGTAAAIVPVPAADLRALALASGVRALGPDSFGLAVPALGLNATAAHLPPASGKLALVSQSAGLCRAVLDWAGPNGVGFSHIIGIGGNHDLGFATALDWLSRDAGTGAILLDIRRIKDPRAFLSAARAAARLRPVVAIRPGAKLLDPDGMAEAAFDAALRRCGVLSVTRLEDLLAAAETLTRAHPAPRETLAIVGNAVGPARFAADAALRAGIALAGEIVRAGGAGLAAAAAAEAAAGGVLVVHAPEGPDDGTAIAAIAAAGRSIKVPLLVAALGETTGAAHRASLAAAGLPVFATPEQAVRGFLHLVQHRRTRAAARELPHSAVLDIAPDRAAVAAILAAAGDRRTLAQDEALAVLAAYGIGAIPTRRARELRLRVTQDALFGPIMSFGQGGTAALGLPGMALDLPPLNLTLARALIGRTPGLLHDWPAADMDTLADALVRVSQLIVDFPAFAELDLTLLLAEAAGVQAGGAWMRLLAPGAPAPRLAIAPYPAELAGRFRGRHEEFLIRPIRPEDAAAHAAFFARLPAEDVRFRFFSAMRALPAAEMARLTQVDYDREIAFIAIRPATGETVGAARLVREDAAGEAAEFAIVVQPDAKGQGLAAHLMRRLIGWARTQGVATVTGQVLADNAAMLDFVRRLGFTLHRVAGEETVMDVRLALA